jgi:hypothetical protein
MLLSHQEEFTRSPQRAINPGTGPRCVGAGCIRKAGNDENEELDELVCPYALGVPSTARWR